MVVLLLLVVASFLGYVLVWGRMSYWAATVITSLLGVLPEGDDLLVSVLGAFTLDGTALARFYALHYVITLVVAALAVLHLLGLHVTGSTPHGGAVSHREHVGFARYYLVKDVVLGSLLAGALGVLLLTRPAAFADAELYAPASSMATPEHIVPEWYLLVYYAVLRGIPSKSLGVVSVALRVAALLLLLVERA